MTWRDWPARRQPARALVAAVIIAGTCGWAAQEHPLLGFVAAGLLLALTAEVLFPSTYTLDPEGVTIRSWVRTRRVRFDKVSGYRPVHDGIALCGTGPSPLIARRRGAVLRGAPSELADELERVGVTRQGERA